MSVILAADYVSLTDGATVATDASAGETFSLTANRASRTMSNPTNPTLGQSINYVVENLWGDTTTSWGSAFALAGTWTEPSVDRARSVSFIYNGSYWVETTRTGWDLKLSFDPGDVASLVGWWDAMSPTYSDAEAVSSWRARVGPGALIGASGHEPTFKTAIQNSRPIVRFDGTNDYLSVGNPLQGYTDCTVLAVFAKGDTSSTSYRALVDVSGTGPAGGVLFENGTAANTVRWDYGIGSGSASVAATSVGTAFHQWSLVHDSGAQPKLYKDAGSAITAVSNASTSFSIGTLYVGSNGGTTRYMNGDLAELLLYSTPLSDADRALVATYLKNKWGTP